MSKKKVLFVCATGIATSTVAEEKVIEYCKEQGIDFDFDQRNVASVPQIADDFDLIIATTNVPYELDTPVISALPLLTGFGIQETLEKIAEALRA
ncbi:PTS sugar transporter subunit IIB [Olegusella massiliensis]|uniref:PTS sugar transporter subunit IIB n=1 Tax=Olegusella massiliensis TaxID=1776381 RepID=UPI0040556A7F